MKALYLALTGIVLLPLGSVLPLHADETGSASAGELKGAERRLARSAAQTKGGGRQLIELEQRRVQRLIEDLESGRPVDAAEIDRALNRAQRY